MCFSLYQEERIKTELKQQQIVEDERVQSLRLHEQDDQIRLQKVFEDWGNVSYESGYLQYVYILIKLSFLVFFVCCMMNEINAYLLTCYLFLYGDENVCYMKAT